jgi:glutaredoxin
MKSLMILVLLGCAAVSHAAQFYEWVDEKGVKQFTQQPPPPNVKNVQQRRLGSNVIETSGASYSLQQAVKNFPVTLYVTDCGDPCKSARAHLSKRGVPFTDKDPQKQDEAETFKKLTGGGMEVPLLLVGELKTIKGYQASEWDSALDAAGYPSTAVPGAKPAASPGK